MAQAISSGSKNDFLFASILSFLLAAMYYIGIPLVHGVDLSHLTDGYRYLHIADGHFWDYHTAPFCWRLGVPFIAYISPLNNILDFQILNFLSAGGMGMIIFRIGKELGYSKDASVLSLVWIFATGTLFHTTAEPVALIDPIVPFFYALLILFALQDKIIAFAITLAIGIIFKESVIFGFPIYYLINAKKWLDWRIAMQTAVTLIIPLAILFFLRKIIIPFNGLPDYEALTHPKLLLPLPSSEANGDNSYTLGNLFQSFGLDRIKKAYLFPVYWAQALGLTTIFVIIGTFRKPQNGLLIIPFILLMSLQLLLASGNHRLLSAGLPFFIFLLGPGFQFFKEKAEWIYSPLIIAGAAICIYKTIAIPPSYVFSGMSLIVESAILGVAIIAGYIFHAANPPTATQ